MQQDIIRTYYIAYEQGNLDSEVIYTRQIQFLLLHVRIVTQTKPDSCHHGAGVWNLLKDQEGDE